MQANIPTAVAAELIALRSCADNATALHVVLHETVSMLIARLHRAGLVDADDLAAQLLHTFSAPPNLELCPLAKEQAEVLAGRILGAVKDASGASPTA